VRPLFVLLLLVGCATAQDDAPPMTRLTLFPNVLRSQGTKELYVNDVDCSKDWAYCEEQLKSLMAAPTPAASQCSADMPHCVIGDPAPWLYVPQQWDTPFTCTYVLQTHTFQADLKAPAPEPFDVPAVGHPDPCGPNPAHRNTTADFCNSRTPLWTCADPLRILLTSEDGKHHCYAFWMVKP